MKIISRDCMPLVLVSLCLILGLSRCQRNELHAAESSESWLEQTLRKQIVPGVMTFAIPEKWNFKQAQYPSQYGNQVFHMVRAEKVASNEDHGLLSVDISPCHPRLWKRSLDDLVASRYKALATLGPITALTPVSTLPVTRYEVMERYVDIAGGLRTVFQIFRQKKRVVTVAFTADRTYFSEKAATRLVREVSSKLLVHLPIRRFPPPKLETSLRRAGHFKAQLPRNWTATAPIRMPTIVPAEKVELMPPNYKSENEGPRLTIAILRLNRLLEEGSEIQALIPSTKANQNPAEGQQPHATIVELNSDTLAAMRVIHLGRDVITLTYAAPDYLFEAKPALDLLDRIAHSIELVP